MDPNLIFRTSSQKKWRKFKNNIYFSKTFNPIGLEKIRNALHFKAIQINVLTTEIGLFLAQARKQLGVWLQNFCWTPWSLIKPRKSCE